MKHTDDNLEWILGWNNVATMKWIIDDQVGTSETTLQWNDVLNCWYTFRIPFSTTYMCNFI